MKPLFIFQHDPGQGPGYLAEFLRRGDVPFEIVHGPQSDWPPSLLENAAGLVFLGGRADVNDAEPWLAAERQLIARAHGRQVPLLGHGLGAELIAEALGGAVVRNPVREIGWFEVQRLEDGDPWLADVPQQFEIFQWHSNGFSYPAGSQRLLKSRWCPTEAFALGKTVALQGHLEMTADMIRDWLQRYGEDVAAPSEDVTTASNLAVNWEAVIQGPEIICQRLDERLAVLHRAADAIYGQWLARLSH